MRSSIAEKPLFLAVAAYTLIADARSSAAFESDGSSSLPSPLLAARAIRASAAHRDASSVSSAYDEPLAGAGNRNPMHHEILHLRHSPEITAFSDRYSEFEKLNTKVLGVSVDSMVCFDKEKQFPDEIMDKLLQYSVVHSDRHLADHFGGKLHLGYMQIREKLAEMQEERTKSRKRDRSGDDRRSVERSRDSDRAASRDRDGDRGGSRERERDYDRRSRDHDRYSDRGRERDGGRSYSYDSRSRRRSRSRSRDRTRDQDRHRRHLY